LSVIDIPVGRCDQHRFELRHRGVDLAGQLNELGEKLAFAGRRRACSFLQNAICVPVTIPHKHSKTSVDP
jgi:hypothetical protein